MRAIPEALSATLDHEELYVRRGERSGLFTLVAVHSTVRGPALGGCRMLAYADPRSAIRDALRLSEGMTYKSAVAGLPLGGGKGVLMLEPGAPPSGAQRRAALLDFAETVERLGGRYVTAEDVGTSTRDMTVIAGATRHVTGLARRAGGSGDPSPYTALGVLHAIRATCEQAFGSPELRGRTVAVVGLGHVGLPLARLLHRAGARLVASDIDPARRADAEALGARWMTPTRAVTAAVDVLAPCALGGVLTAATVASLRAPAVAGAANNQLADASVADALRERRIVWAPDFVANAGGIINIAHELEPGGYDARRARARTIAIGDTLRAIFDEARRDGVTELAAAMALAHRRLGPASLASGTGGWSSRVGRDRPVVIRRRGRVLSRSGTRSPGS